ncbi:MAG: hypothetical protein HQL12_00705 [Candidatus Omnitrophica bacterium]|nr:hypothetical protein [Candidatus Omnitrophota bacterium]
MSIIHDALKKVQQSLTSKNAEPENPPSGTTQKGDTYLYAPSPVEDITPAADQKSAEIKTAVFKKIKFLFNLICVVLIMTGAVWYLYQQFKNEIPRAKRLAKKSFYQLIHKEELPDFKNKTPEDLKPLGQITVKPPMSPRSDTAPTANTPPMAAPVTLKIHGIMSNATGNLALINNQVYQEGDEVAGAKIIKINFDSVTVNINGTEKTIFVKN